MQGYLNSIPKLNLTYYFDRGHSGNAPSINNMAIIHHGFTTLDSELDVVSNYYDFDNFVTSVLHSQCDCVDRPTFFRSVHGGVQALA